MDSKKDVTQMDVSKLWTDYSNSRDEETRQKLIEHYLCHVKRIASIMHRRFPQCVQLEDLVSAGMLGLLDAIGSYDPTRKTRFETFCWLRVTGAMRDYLRGVDTLSRHQRTQSNRLLDAREIFRQLHGREASDAELCEMLDVTEKQLAKLQRISHAATEPMSLSQRTGSASGGRDLNPLDAIADRSEPAVLSTVHRRSLREAICRGLSRTERLIIMLRYFEQFSMRQIGDTLDITESRVSQIHSAVIVRLQERLSPRLMDEAA